MSTLQIRQGGTFAPVGGSSTSEPVVEPYVRPADWLALPAVTSTAAGKFVGLAAVYEGDSNWVAITCAGAYTVDWGDGTAPVNYASGVKAEYNILWANVPSSTLTSRGYRQAIVTVTPQAGSNLTSIDLSIRPTVSVTLALHTSSLWLDITMAGTSIASLSASAWGHQASMLERFEYVGTSAIAMTSVSYALSYARSLRSLVGSAWTANATNFSYMFSGCSALEAIPLLDTAKGTNFSNMFNGCASLKAIPLLDTAKGTDFSRMFEFCFSLKAIPLLNTALGTQFFYMFKDCAALQTIPLLNTARGTDFTGMFQSCKALEAIPLLDTVAGTQFGGMFLTCASLRTIPLLNTVKGTNFASMFNSCTALQAIPLLNTAAATDCNSMFQDCVALQTIPLLNTSNVTNFSAMFRGCTNLQAVPLLNVAKGTTFGSSTPMFSSCSSLQQGALSGTTRSINYSSAKLSAAALNAIYTNLGTAFGAQTITVTANPGTAGDDPSIATAKGWTVTGS